MRKANRAVAGAAAWQVIQNTDSCVSVWQRVGAVPRMVGAKLRGRYPELSGSKLFAMLVMAVYIISPIDFIPEWFVPLLGVADDVGVAVWLTTMALGESERFVQWERQNRVYADGEHLGHGHFGQEEAGEEDREHPGHVPGPDAEARETDSRR